MLVRGLRAWRRRTSIRPVAPPSASLRGHTYLLVKHGLVQAYVSPNASAVAPSFKASDGTWTGGAARARLLLVNKRLVKPEDMPRSVRDLANPRWRGRGA